MAVLLLLVAAEGRAASPPQDLLSVAGIVRSPSGEGVRGATVEVRIGGQRLEPQGQEGGLRTNRRGDFVADFILPRGTLPGAPVTMEASKPNWRSPGPIVAAIHPAGEDSQGNRRFQGVATPTVSRQITPAFWLAAGILGVTFGLLMLEVMHRTLASLLGAAAILFLSYTLGTFFPEWFIISFDDAMRAIDMNVIFLLLGMMIIVGVLKRTGLFQWLAYQAYRWARGSALILCAILMVVTAVASAFLDNVTTMLLIIPVTIELAITLKLDPRVLLIPEVFASNVGGAATLIGDPPNLLIGSYAHLTFVDFLVHLTGIVSVCLVFAVAYYLWWQRRELGAVDARQQRSPIVLVPEEYQITDARLLGTSLVILGLTIGLFLLHGVLHMEASIAALIGAMALLTCSRVNIVTLLEEDVEWPTLVFFMGLFIVVAGAEETGLIQLAADGVVRLSQGSLLAAVLLVLGVSAVASAAVDNIPFTATMLPVVAYLNQQVPGAADGILWWSLALGACLGGNATVIGASANVVTVGLAERAGYPISFLEYLKACTLPTLGTLGLCAAYLIWQVW